MLKHGTKHTAIGRHQIQIRTVQGQHHGTNKPFTQGLSCTKVKIRRTHLIGEMLAILEGRGEGKDKNHMLTNIYN
jgi:hypothetical protein